MRSRSLTSLLIVLSSACASSGANTAPPETVSRVQLSGAGIAAELYNEPGMGGRTVPLDIDLVWGALPDVYEQLDIPDAAGDPQRMLYGNPGYRPRRIEGKRLSTYIDCGSGATAIPNADQYDVTMTILTQVTREEDGNGTVIMTTIDANAKPRAHTGNSIHCQSKGVL